MQSSTGAQGSWREVRIAQARPAEFGLARIATLADDLTRESADPALLIWRAEPALLVTRQETRLPHFHVASDRMRAAGWPIIVRKSGGAACPIGLGTVQVATIEPTLPDTTMNAKYDALAKLIQFALQSFRIDARTGSIAGAYCPGSYDFAVQGKKIAGMSQHWFRNGSGIRCVVTTASINVEEAPDVLAEVVNEFNRTAGSPARCQTTALTNMRRCDGAAFDATPNLAPALMSRLGAFTLSRDRAIRQEFEFVRPLACVAQNS